MYTFAGNTLEFNGSYTRAVVVPDTTVWVDDAMAGLNGVYYIESVRRARTPQTITTIRLMRPEDLVFGDISSPATKPSTTSTLKTGTKGAFDVVTDGGAKADGTVSSNGLASQDVWAGGSSSGGTPPPANPFSSR